MFSPIDLHVTFRTDIRTVVAMLPSFGRQNFFCDSDEIPIHSRYRLVTPTGYKDDLTEGSLPRDYANVFFGQKVFPQDLMITRWVSTASKPYWVAGPNYSKDVAAWASHTETTMDITDGTATANVVALDFSGVTSLTQILPILTAATQAQAATIPDLGSAEWKINSRGELILEMPSTGPSATSVTVTATGIGTELLDYANGTEQVGLAAETPQRAMDLVKLIYKDFYNVGIRGITAADTLTADEALAFALYMQSERKQLDVVSHDANVIDPASTTDVAYLLAAGNYLRTGCLFSQVTDDLMDAAYAGRCLPATPGTLNWAHTSLLGVADAGLTAPLGDTERAALKDKRCSHVENIEGDLGMYDAITAGGAEKRVVLGVDAFDVGCQVKIYNFMKVNDLVAFEDWSMSKLYNIIDTEATIFKGRNVIADTPERPFIITMPRADEISAETRATRELTSLEAYNGYYVSAINDIHLQGYLQQ